jgi:1-acyl-sn-glycerol-3-phosphate acyltransferase
MAKVLRTLFFFPLFWLHQLLIAPLLGVLLLLRKRHPEVVRRHAGRVGRSWGRLVLWLSGARVAIADRSTLAPGQAALVVSNHQGAFDIPLLMGYVGRDIGFVAKKELANIPFVSAWMRLVGCVFLDREDRRKQVAQIRETIETLRSGQSMVIFPEGTRSNGPQLGEFAKGSLSIAAKAGVPIQPVTLDHTWVLKQKGRWGLPGGQVRVVLHPAIDPAALSAEDQNRLHELVRGVIEGGLRS